LAKSVKCVLFDIGGVLIDQNLRLLARGLSIRTGQDADRVLSLLGKEVVLEVETGKLSAESFFDRTIAPALTGISYEDWIGAWMDNYSVNPAAWGLLEEARDHGSMVCILSNLSEFNKIAIERKFPHFFGAVHRSFLSYELGLHKPDPAIYVAVAGTLKMSPGDCLFLDDVEENVQGARAAGMASMRFDSGRIEEIRSGLLPWR
jgi:HAD superfamily hydrolase (TIGR01509 family)